MRVIAALSGPRASPLVRGEFFAALACVLVNVLDGFDILVMSVAAGTVGRDLSLTTAQLGMMFSCGLAGMMCGASLLAPLSDRFGRRRLILACLLVNALGMFATGTAASGTQLYLFRFITGLGVGGMMPTVNTAIAEVVHARRRNLAVLIQCAAYPAGGLLATALWGWLSQDYSWRQVLQFSSTLSLMCMVLVAICLPETVPFLLSRRARDTLTRVNATHRRLGLPLLQALPAIESGGSHSQAQWAPTGLLRRNLLCLALATFLTQFSFYFFVSWLPSLLSGPGGKPGAGTFLLNIGGIAGDFVLAALALTVALRRLASATMVLAFLSIGAIAMTLNHEGLTVAIAAIVGAALYAAMAAIYGCAPNVFPTRFRAAGTGIAFSVGRLGGALSPAVGAILLSNSSLALPAVLLIMAVPILLAAWVIGFLQVSSEI